MENNNEENLVKIEITLDRIFYPKYAKKIDSGEYGIFSARISTYISDYDNSIGDYIKLKGNVCKLEYGSTYRVTCKLAEHNETYGDTYEVLSINKKIDISTRDKQIEFLNSIINETYVSELFKTHDDVIQLLEDKNIEELTKVKGIGGSTAMRLINEYEDSKDYSSIFVELGSLGLTSTLIKKLTDFYKSPDVVVKVIKENPYELTMVDGIGFKKADDIALRMGYVTTDFRRIKAFLLHTLSENGELGKSYLGYQELLQILYDTLGFVPESVITKTAQSMVENEDVIVVDNGERIALNRYYNLEKSICEELIRLKNGLSEDDYNTNGSDEDFDDVYNYHTDYIPPKFDTIDWLNIVSEIEKSQGFEFTDEQKYAIESVTNNNVIALTGLGGTGKSTVAKAMCLILKDANITAMALSGKASLRIKEATGIEASTIHRALGFSREGFIYNKQNKLPTDIVLIDEATMINGTLFRSILEATPTGAKVIIMGDPNQLTPIGNCQIFVDILESNVMKSIRLTKIHRQAQKSAIISSGIDIANQKSIIKKDFTGKEIRGELQDVELDIFNKGEELSNHVLSHYFDNLNRLQSLNDILIVVAKKVDGDLSCYNLNTKIQDIINPKKSDDDFEIIVDVSKKRCKQENRKYYHIRVGDKVINMKNNYETITTDGMKIPIYNGNTGIVIEIDQNGYVTVDFEGIGNVVIDKKNTSSLELGYAITTHKIQGSQANTVIMALDTNSYIMNTSELVYTMSSRPTKNLIIVAINSALNSAIKRKEVKTKQTFLKEFLLEMENKKNED